MSTYNKYSLYTCPACGAKFSPAANSGICPYCHNTNNELINMQRNNFKRSQIRKKQIRRAIIRLSVIAALFVVLLITAIAVISNIFKSSESLIFSHEDDRYASVFYEDSDGLIYFNGKNQPILIGKGIITEQTYSKNQKTSFFVFEGTKDVDSMTSGGSTLYKISDSDTSPSLVAETPYGNIFFVTAGNSKYIYYMINEAIGTYQNSSRLYVYDVEKNQSKKIDEYSTQGDFLNFRVSPNGRYMIYKSQDGNGTKLMKFCVKNSSSEPLGIKNAEPVSIDNKGKYYSYLKINADGGTDFYVESGVSDREKIALDKAAADRILVSSDSRSFLIETGNITMIKTVSSEPVTIATHTGSGIGIDIIPSSTRHDSNSLIPSLVHTVEQCENESFFPYYYLNNNNGTVEIMVCEKNGTKNRLTDNVFNDFVTNGKKIAAIFDKTFSTFEVNYKNSALTLVSENFDGYSLKHLSDNGKYVYYSDTDGNLYRIPFNFNGSDWIKVAIDAQVFKISEDGKLITYTTDDTLYQSRDGVPSKISENILIDSVYLSSGGEKIYFLAESDSSKAENAYSLYSFNGKNLEKLADNVTKIYAADYLSLTYINTPFSTYKEHVAPNISTRTDEIADSVTSNILPTTQEITNS